MSGDTDLDICYIGLTGRHLHDSPIDSKDLGRLRLASTVELQFDAGRAAQVAVILADHLEPRRFDRVRGD